MGGSAYVVRIAGAKVAHPFVALSLPGLDVREIEELERQAEERRYLPPWMKRPIEQSEQNLRKTV